MLNSVLFIIITSIFGKHAYYLGLNHRLISVHTLCLTCSHQVSIEYFSDELNVIINCI